MLVLSCVSITSVIRLFFALTSEDFIALFENSPTKISVDHLQRRKFFRLNNFELKILRGEFFQNYGIISMS